MISDPDEEVANLEIGLSAFCSVRGGGGDQVCAEQITVHVEGPPAGHLESLAGPLLIPDLPVFLWYPGAFSPGMPPFESMVALADRLVIDTAATGDQALCLREMAVMLEGEGIPEVGDLQWVGLSPWRTLIAELFSPPERARELEEIRHVEVLHNPDGESRALLLVGWLASSLGWRPQRASRTGEGRKILFDAPAGEIAVEMSSNSPDASLRRVRLYGKELSFQVSRHRELAEAASTVMREGELMAGRTTHLGSFDPATILGEELQYRGRDLYYRSALKTVAEILDL